MTYQYIQYEFRDPGIAWISLARPEKRNAQSIALLYELNSAFDQATADDDVRVIVLAGQGLHFSSGHDPEGAEEAFSKPVGTAAGYWESHVAGLFAQEAEAFLDLCERWRNLAKVTIAQVQGKCIAGGLALAWICDLIVASDDAVFSDPTLDMGVSGVEYFMYPYELGWRKAKEFLLTGEPLGAKEAMALGMVNKVVPRDELEQAVHDLASRIARKPAFAVRTAKLALNHMQDQAGRAVGVRHSFALHQLTHADNQVRLGMPFDLNGFPPHVAEKFRALAAKHSTLFGAKKA